MFNPSTKLVVDCYADEDFAGLWGHGNNQETICARSRTGFVVKFSKLSSIVGLKTIDRYVSIYYTLLLCGILSPC